MSTTYNRSLSTTASSGDENKNEATSLTTNCKDQEVDYSDLDVPPFNPVCPYEEVLKNSLWFVEHEQNRETMASTVLGLMKKREQNGIQSVDSETALDILKLSTQTNNYVEWVWKNDKCKVAHLDEEQTILNHGVDSFCPSLKEEKPKLWDKWLKSRESSENKDETNLIQAQNSLINHYDKRDKKR
ncbi:uncharacterized protein I206_106156 [Kwoniella pini CBS 10737]|uniref:Uncharacterized protein n=1 Tax=Kwoniella pini CBS 10737 TaxID=1296096 RepID=A0A1B9I166_9TREE|nr:uncharacterized protein I206_04981 [Kwoniella pini CBS 10737]OCF49292.1 hypothetical protein I206_04981 [Kwoniella pini CBS 10737]